MHIDYNQLIHALSDTIDLVGVDELQHGKRVAYMAACCAEVMGQNDERKLFLYRAGLLHDCGVSSTKVHKNLVNEMEWTGSDTHCLIGAERMELFAPLAEFSTVIRYHHTRWENLVDEPLPQQVKQDTNLIYLLDRVDALAAMSNNPNRLTISSSVCDKIRHLQHNYFDPEMISVFLEAAEKEAFWITQEPQFLNEYIRNQQQLPDNMLLETGQLKDMARIFAEIVDAKSTYTAEHSAGVANLSSFLAERTSLPEKSRSAIEVAALLHDLGKLQVPDAILDYDGGLEGESLSLMRHHSYVTYIILNRISGLEKIALWAANHHEKLDGSGYPFRRNGEELDIESRIIMVADIFQALAQNRPYRASLPVDEILSILTKMAKNNKIDHEVVSLLADEPDTCYQVATGILAP